ncbi:hypothetical protein [Cohnella nanjingensis]|uniref:Uncharacterized protein n=1 Tax=Cohnella nanjingensis TaxID=1387779 RepID=A0A7X0VEF9_9BACL|nr:hypothetical protein [Cohnella nanjingensis]MBB6670972.1 hypothetical protein [Cohnella nanjingensis]
MTKVIFGMTMSLDGFINDANGSVQAPIQSSSWAKGESCRIKEKKKAGFFRPEPLGASEADR